MEKYSIQYSKDAKQDIVDIKKHIKYKLQEPNIAEKLTNKIKTQIDNAADNPTIHSIIDDDFIKKLEIRKIIVDNYIVFYRTNVNTKTIEIIRIMYARRNWLNLL